MSDVASEFSCAQDLDRFWLLAGIVDKLDFTGFDDEKVGIAIATAKKRLSGFEFPRQRAGVMSEPSDLFLAQRRESNRV